METYTVLFIYHTNACIIKRYVPQDAVDRIIAIQENESKWKKIIITPTKNENEV